MKKQRRRNVEFKRQVVEELLSGVSTLAQLSRRYEVAVSLIQTWKKKYTDGELVRGPSKDDRAVEGRIAELERMVGRLTMENDLLKKAATYIEKQRRKISLPITAKNLEALKEDVKS